MNTDYEYWKNYRKNLIQLLKKDDEKTNPIFSKEERKNQIQKMAKEIGIKATARYFHIDSKTVRYWLKR